MNVGGVVRTWSVLVALTIVGAGGITGCESVGQDLTEFADGLMAPTPTEAALMAKDEYNADRRREGTLLLANAPFGGEAPYVGLYRLRVETDANPLVRAVSIRALAKHGTPEDVALIIPHLEDASMQVRWEAAKGLQRLHNSDAIGPLLATLKKSGENADVRVAAAVALGQYPSDQVFQGLVSGLTVRELAVNMASSESLHVMTGQDIGLDARTWLNWYEANGDTAFDGRLEYRYPTYHRDSTMLERFAFWSSRTEEQPAPPAGLRSPDERRTYVDSEVVE